MDLQFKQAAAEEKRLPGTSGIWTFLFMDMIVFFAIFAVFASERSRIPAVYLSSQQQLNGWLGLANTIVLLTSSWFMVRAVQAARMNDCRAVRVNMNGAIAAALIFIISKSYEYYSKFFGWNRFCDKLILFILLFYDNSSFITCNNRNNFY